MPSAPARSQRCLRPARWRRRGAGVLALGLGLAEPWLASPGLARALESEAAPSRAPSVAFVALGPHAHEVFELFEAIVRARAGGVRIVPPSDSEPRATNDTVVVVVDTSDEGRWRLSLRHAGRRYERELAGGLREDAAIVEAAALIAAQAALALLESPQQEALPEWTQAVSIETAPPTPLPSATPPVETPPALPAEAEGPFVGAAYAVTSFGAPASLQHGAAAWLGFGWRSGLELALRAAHHPSLSVETEFGSFELGHHPVEVSLGFAYEASHAFRATAHLGALLEHRRRSQGRASSAVAATPSRTSWHPGASAAVGLATRLTGSLWFGLSLGAEAVVGFDYVAAGQDSPPLLAPYPVRPRVDLGLSYRFDSGD